MRRQRTIRRKNEQGFTLTEMLMATVIVLFGLVGVAQLVPTSVMLNSNNRNDGTALAFAQREIDILRAQSLSSTGFSDPQGIACPSGQTCLLGDFTQPTVQIGSPVVIYNGSPVIDFSQSPVAGYSFSYTDPNDPTGAAYDVRWMVITNVATNPQVVVYRRIVLGVMRRGMQTPTLPVTLDVQVEK
jgi:prepilin-type N-terminal cleavage/methylation domain-containing protein